MSRSFIVSFNTHNIRNIAGTLKAIINKSSYDNIFIALQENLSFSEYKSIIKMAKNEFTKYKTFHHSKLFGLTTIFISKERIEPVRIFKMGLGPFNFPNKGFVAFQVRDMVFVNCHLIAHEKNRKRRLEMFEIMLNCIHSRFETPETVLIAGDLNFRIPKNSKTLEYLNTNQFEKMRAYDEMVEVMEKYPNFKENEITFMPTFKYVINSNKLDMKRFPSWCDRIILASNYRVEIDEYDSLNQNISDHRPVYAEVTIFGENVRKGDLFHYKSVNFLKFKFYLTLLYSFLYEYLIFIVILIVSVFVSLFILRWSKFYQRER